MWDSVHQKNTAEQTQEDGGANPRNESVRQTVHGVAGVAGGGLPREGEWVKGQANELRSEGSITAKLRSSQSRGVPETLGDNEGPFLLHPAFQIRDRTRCRE